MFQFPLFPPERVSPEVDDLAYSDLLMSERDEAKEEKDPKQATFGVRRAILRAVSPSTINPSNHPEALRGSWLNGSRP